jgi:hypothetical protein
MALVGHRAVLGLSSMAPSDATLANLVPQVPTWFLPETFPGYALVIALMCLALWGRMLGKRIDAWHNHI